MIKHFATLGWRLWSQGGSKALKRAACRWAEKTYGAQQVSCQNVAATGERMQACHLVEMACRDGESLPLFAVVGYGGRPGARRVTLKSLQRQWYPFYTVVDGGDGYPRKDAVPPMVAWAQALEQRGATFGLVLEWGSLLTPECLYRIWEASRKAPGAEIFFGDECRYRAKGAILYDRTYVSSVGRESFRSHPLRVGRSVFFHGNALHRLQTQSKTFYEVLCPKTLSLAVVDSVLFQRGPQQAVVRVPHVLVAHARKLTRLQQHQIGEHLEKWRRPLLEAKGLFLKAKRGSYPGSIVTSYPLAPHARVSVIIPTRDASHYLKKCVQSLLMQERDFPWEVVLVDHETQEREAKFFIAEFKELFPEHVQVVPYCGAFHFSQMVNAGVAASRGNVIVLLNNDAAFCSTQALKNLASFALLPHAGAVGAKLLYPHLRVQHAGIVLCNNQARHVGVGLKKQDPFVGGRTACIQNYLAVTAACLAVAKEKFELVGGFSRELAVEYNDIDFCLKLYSQGWENIWLPQVEVIHAECVTRGYNLSPAQRERKEQERRRAVREWAPLFMCDPYYHPALSSHTPYRKVRKPGLFRKGLALAILSFLDQKESVPNRQQAAQ